MKSNDAVLSGTMDIPCFRPACNFAKYQCAVYRLPPSTGRGHSLDCLQELGYMGVGALE